MSTSNFVSFIQFTFIKNEDLFLNESAYGENADQDFDAFVTDEMLSYIVTNFSEQVHAACGNEFDSLTQRESVRFAIRKIGFELTMGGDFYAVSRDEILANPNGFPEFN